MHVNVNRALDFLKWFLSFALRIATAHDILTCTWTRLRVQNLRDFPQSKLDSELSASFLLNEHGDLHFLLHKNIVHIIFFNWKGIKNFVGRKKI